MGQRLRQGEVQPAVGEAVRGDVEDAHQPRAVEREAADRGARGGEAKGDVGRQISGGEEARVGAAPVQGGVGEPERAAGEGKGAGRARAAGHRDGAVAGAGHAVLVSALEGRDRPGVTRPST